ncbi:hypothetical protein HMPREF1978_00461 [Actinomyces graevenitzii F0530]|uniref:Uncharacterized protein n=1 Tax=Actinomyces graevenitzii F0530 TaxID=1321817 RepID=U1Q525_9ACTO|nr:hypothetical protein HMPREF1978_00461 [Actinomyces graevenitzii F0530]
MTELMCRRRRQGSEEGRAASLLLVAGLKYVCQGGGPAASLAGPEAWARAWPEVGHTKTDISSVAYKTP